MRVTDRGEGGGESVVTPVAAVLGEAAPGGGVVCSSGTKDWRRLLIGGAASRCSGLGAELVTRKRRSKPECTYKTRLRWHLMVLWAGKNHWHSDPGRHL